MLTPIQAQAASLLHKPVILMASAGSGKTTVLVERYCNYLEQGIPSHRIWAMSFTIKASDELRTRIRKRMKTRSLPSLADRDEELKQCRSLGTIHSFCLQLLYACGSRLGLPTQIQVVSKEKFCLAFHDAFWSWYCGLDKDVQIQIQSQLPLAQLESTAIRLYETRHEMTQHNKFTKESLPTELRHLWDFAWHFEAREKQRGHCLFGDLEGYTRQLLQDPSLVLEIRKKYDAVFVDEFQDTSPLQWDILRTLFAPPPFERLFLIGDPKQSIYGFRGATSHVFTEAWKLLQQNGGVALEMHENFRAHPKLITAINQVSKTLFEDSALPWTPMLGQDIPVTNPSLPEAAPPSPPSAAALSPGLHYHFCTSGQHVSETWLQEKEAILSVVRAEEYQGSQLADICILLRTHDTLWDCARFLASHGVPCHNPRDPDLRTHPLVRGTRVFLEALISPTSAYWLWALLCTLRVPLHRIAHLLAKRDSSGGVLWPMPPEELEWFCNLVNSGETRLEYALGTFLKAWRTSVGEIPHDTLLNLGEHLNHTDIFTAAHYFRIWQSQNIPLHVSESPASPHREGVQLLTLHASKGLEFPVVILAGLTRVLPQAAPPFVLDRTSMQVTLRGRSGDHDEMLTAYRETQKEQEEKEHDRLVYVALTRAKLRMHVIIPQKNPLATKDKAAARGWAKGLLANAL